MHRLAVGGDDGHAVSLDGHLGRANGGEGVYHAEAVPSAGRDGEYLERRVRHESRVRVSELAAAVDEHRLGVLAGVDGQAAREALGGVLVQPVADQHDVRRQVEVVEVRVRVPRGRLPHDDAAVQPVNLLQAGVRMPEVGASVAGPLVSAEIEKQLVIVYSIQMSKLNLYLNVFPCWMGH